MQNNGFMPFITAITSFTVHRVYNVDKKIGRPEFERRSIENSVNSEWQNDTHIESDIHILMVELPQTMVFYFVSKNIPKFAVIIVFVRSLYTYE